MVGATLSDDWLHIIPATRGYMPSENQMRDAASILASAWADTHPRIVRAEETSQLDSPNEIVIQVVLRKEVEFLGMALETIRCPRCAKVLESDWWVAAVDHAYVNRFADLSVKTPCCANETSLNDLAYEPPVAFARFSITILNPFREIGRAVEPEHGPGYWVQLKALSLNADTLARIGATLGCTVRALWVHF